MRSSISLWRFRRLPVLAAAFCLPAVAGERAESAEDQAKPAAAATKVLQLELRARVETGKGSGRYRPVRRKEGWDPRQTAVIVCDMWDLHHCLNATRRGAELTPRMNKVLSEARRRGAAIIHAPSGCMAAYKNHAARKHAVNTPRAKSFPQDIGRWCHWLPAEERDKYPIDQSDGGEDDDPTEHANWAKQLKGMGRNPRAPWKSQTDLLVIRDSDYISDNGQEVWSILEHRGIKNVILVGVHTNMCVLGRPFGLRNMAQANKNVVLMRDMTDTMYNPRKKPQVSHFTGTDLIVEHIEKYVCPTITSDQIIGGRSFRFKHDRRKHVVMLIAEREYKTDQTLPVFAARHLGKQFKVSVTLADPKNRHSLPGAEQLLERADVLLLSVRRRALPREQMAAVRRFLAAGKPVVGIRTASHAFSLRGKKPPPGHYTLERFDQFVFGGNYHGHHGRSVKVRVRTADRGEEHAILEGVEVEKLISGGSLYQVRPLAESTRKLLIGSIPGQPAEPVAWINTRRGGGKAFYTSLGHVEDFKLPSFNRLLRNAVYWAAGVKFTEEVPPGS